jgi:hypothetical protein
MMNDFHTHSNCSDGPYSPEGLVDYAQSCNVKTLALCDHDTTGGNDRFMAQGEKCGVRTIPGVEISATWPSGNCHICGLGVRNDYGPLEEVLAEIRGSRGGRNEKIVARLNELGMNVTMEEIKEYAGGDVVGRPHIARLLKDRGYVGSVQEAFDTYLAKGKAAYIDRYRLDPPDAVALLAAAGAMPVLAHPSQLTISVERIRSLTIELKAKGLGGIEVYTPYSDDTLVAAMERLAGELRLLKTGGSDFHGESKPDHLLGYYRTDIPIPPIQY